MKESSLVSVLVQLQETPGISQRTLAQKCKLSLGAVNARVKACKAQGFLNDAPGALAPSPAGRAFLAGYRVDNAIILAAGFGQRFIPMTFETPKGLLKVNGKPMLEGQIEQLHEKGIEEIILVVGYMKEAFDYLIDKYGVKLVFNPEFSTKNNLASLYHALPYLKNSYLLCADNWIEENIFARYEAQSWFSCLYQQGPTAEWCVTGQTSGRITKIDIGGADALAIVGPAYFTADFSKVFSGYVRDYYMRPGTEDFYWEHVLREHLRELPIYTNVQTGNVFEFENLEELRRYDKSYINQTNNSIMQDIARQFNVQEGKIANIYPLKEGLTNTSFHFSVEGKQYVYRKPGIGTDKLINRANEKQVYEIIDPMDLTDEIVSFNSATGVKITHYYVNSRQADPFNDAELKTCMEQVAQVHRKKLSVPHSFDIAQMISYYYDLAKGREAIRFSDIEETLGKVRRLLNWRRDNPVEEVLCHGDYAYTNVLFIPNGHTRLIDWEFAGMADPLMDVAMYAIFAEFDRRRIDLAARLYCGREPTRAEWVRLYLYVALGGFLWCMWSEYKQSLGQEFGEYPLKMYRYMKDYYVILIDEYKLEAVN